MRPRKRFIYVKETYIRDLQKRPTNETDKRNLQKRPRYPKGPTKETHKRKSDFHNRLKMWKTPTKENYKCERKRHQKRITYVKETYKSDPNTWKRPTRETYKCERDLKGDSYM